MSSARDYMRTWQSRHTVAARHEYHCIADNCVLYNHTCLAYSMAVRLHVSKRSRAYSQHHGDPSKHHLPRLALVDHTAGKRVPTAHQEACAGGVRHGTAY